MKLLLLKYNIMVGNGIQLTVREEGDVLLDPDVAGPHSLTNQVRIALID